MILQLLKRKSSFKILLGLNIISIIGVFYLSSKIEFPDANSYLYMANGIKHGVFSSWYFLPVYSPETLRTWGYPFFIYLCELIHDSPLTIKLVQLLLHFGTVLLALRIVRHFTKDFFSTNLFLLLLLPSLQVAYYAGQIASEAPTIFFIVLFYYVWYIWIDSWKKYIFLGILAFIIFQFRPVFLLIPFLMVGYKLLFNRTALKYHFGFLFVFIVTLLPFGLWNKNAHGVFKVTPLEGGAGAANIGYWSFRLPDGYNPKFYWDSFFSTDLTQPSFASEVQKQQYQLEYENEWKEINEQLKPFITKDDSVRLEFYKEKKYRLWEVMSGGYTLAREKLLKQYLIRDIKANPMYYFKTRLYTMARLWFTGINKAEFQKSGFAGKIKLLYPFLVTFILIFLGLLFIILAVIKKWLSIKQFWPLLIVIAYYGIAHIPFCVQARYTVPVHIFILILLAIAIDNIIHRNKKLVVSTKQ